MLFAKVAFILIALGIGFTSSVHASPDGECEETMVADDFRDLFSAWRTEVSRRLNQLMNGERAPITKKVTHQDLADLLHVSTTQITQMVNGKATATLNQARTIADHLKYQVDELFDCSERALKTPRRFWVNGDMAYQAYIRSVAEGKYQNQNQLASDAEISQRAISFSLNGKSSLEEKVARRIARALDLDFATAFRHEILCLANSSVLISAMHKNRLGIIKAYSQADMGKLIGVHQSIARYYLRGERAIPIAYAEILAQHFEVELSWVLAGDLLESWTRSRGRLDPARISKMQQRVYAHMIETAQFLSLL